MITGLLNLVVLTLVLFGVALGFIGAAAVLMLLVILAVAAVDMLHACGFSPYKHWARGKHSRSEVHGQ